MLGVNLMNRSQLSNDLAGQSIFDRPPDQRIAIRKRRFLGLLAPFFPLGRWPKPWHDRAEIIADDFDWPVGHEEGHAIAVDFERKVGLTSFAEVDQLGAGTIQGKGGQRDQHDEDTESNRVCNGPRWSASIENRAPPSTRRIRNAPSLALRAGIDPDAAL